MKSSILFPSSAGLSRSTGQMLLQPLPLFKLAEDPETGPQSTVSNFRWQQMDSDGIACVNPGERLAAAELHQASNACYCVRSSNIIGQTDGTAFIVITCGMWASSAGWLLLQSPMHTTSPMQVSCSSPAALQLN